MPHAFWKQPALQANEAVLLPALERSACLTSRSLSIQEKQNSFQPVGEPWEEQPVPAADSHTGGSMAGRSVLRAAGVYAEPLCKRKYSLMTKRLTGR